MGTREYQRYLGYQLIITGFYPPEKAAVVKCVQTVAGGKGYFIIVLGIVMSA